VSGTAHDHLQGKLDVPLEFTGEQRVKNIERTRGKTPGRRMPLIRLDESALQILDNLALNTARQRSSSNHKRSLKPRDCHVAIGYWATRRNTWRHPQVASTAALQKRRSIKDLPLPGVLPLVPASSPITDSLITSFFYNSRCPGACHQI